MQDDWQLLTNLRSLAESFANHDAGSDTYLQSENKAYPVQLFPPSSHIFRLDLLCLIATFYWARTTERLDNANMILPLADIEAMTSKVSENLNISIDSTDDTALYDENDLLHYNCIKSNTADESGLYLMYERRLAIGFQSIVDLLADILSCHLTELSYDKLARLRLELSICIDLFLRYTTKTVLLLREFQSLLWIVDVLIKDDSFENRMCFYRIGIAHACILESRLGTLTSTFIGDRLELTSVTWGRPWSKR